MIEIKREKSDDIEQNHCCETDDKSQTLRMLHYSIPDGRDVIARNYIGIVASRTLIRINVYVLGIKRIKGCKNLQIARLRAERTGVLIRAKGRVRRARRSVLSLSLSSPLPHSSNTLFDNPKNDSLVIPGLIYPSRIRLVSIHRSPR